jgi:hypothetical protein
MHFRISICFRREAGLEERNVFKLLRCLPAVLPAV